MPQDYNFNDAFILGDGIGELSRPELLELAREICRALMDTEGKYHGNIHTGNISRTPNGETGLGPKAEHGPGDWTSDELEYMAPELFWKRDGDAAVDATVDVYSVGLVLFAGVSGGKLPFFPDGAEEPKPQERAAALRRRMSGEEIAIPAEAGEKLGAVIKKALAYSPEERYSGPVEMLSALADCPDTEEAAAVVLPVAPPADEDAETVKPPVLEYKVDKNFECKIEKDPPKPRKVSKPAMVVLGICAAIIILALLIKSCSGDWLGVPAMSTSSLDATTGTVTPTADLSDVSPSAGIDMSPSPGLDVSPSPDASAPNSSPTPTKTPTPTPAPTPTPSPTPKPESTYKLYTEDVSWTEAAEKCRELGGHLVTISDAAELKKVTDLADSKGVKLVWIGFYRDISGNLVWLNDEDIDFYVWRKGEPSVTDTDGTAENYGLLWMWGNRTGWIYNDSRNDPVADYPSAYSGKISYICEFEP